MIFSQKEDKNLRDYWFHRRIKMMQIILGGNPGKYYQVTLEDPPLSIAKMSEVPMHQMVSYGKIGAEYDQQYQLYHLFIHYKGKTVRLETLPKSSVPQLMATSQSPSAILNDIFNWMSFKGNYGVHPVMEDFVHQWQQTWRARFYEANHIFSRLDQGFATMQVGPYDVVHFLIERYRNIDPNAEFPKYTIEAHLLNVQHKPHHLGRFLLEEGNL